jgi:ribonucleoside-diphosphate reductase alpha chain
MKFKRHFTDGSNPFEYVEWTKDDVELTNMDTGEKIFKLEQAEVPLSFDRNSREILVTKYFRMTEVPIELVPVDEVSKSGKPVPDWLRRNEPTEEVKNVRETLRKMREREDYLRLRCDQNDVAAELKKIRQEITERRVEFNRYFTNESSAKQVFHRLAGFWTYWGWMNGYFDAESDARIFYDETIFMLSNQIAAPNTPQWFNSGLHWAYGIEGEKKGFWRYNPELERVEVTPNFYQYPGIHACHILGVTDSLFDESGIYDNLTIEAKAFAIGGGAGKNTSNIRSKYEYLRTGSRASGSMEFAGVDDKSAGVIKSGSGQRRAAKMVIKDIDDPEVAEFITWKAKEEKKVEALEAGGFSARWEGEAYKTVSGQNSNNSVRISDKFMGLIHTDKDWPMICRTTGDVATTLKAKELWKLITAACWRSGDPGVQYDSTIQAWDTCPRDGRIRATNPCAEYVFKDNTSCNLASLNLQALFEDTGEKLRIDDFTYACKHWLVVLDISVEAAQLPSYQLASGTAMYRTTGLGHTGLGAVLERAGIPYDSDQGCHLAAAVSSLMTAQCYTMSAKLAHKLGTFARYKDNKKDMLRVLNNHRTASRGGSYAKKTGYDGVKIAPWEIDHAILPKDLSKAVIGSWDEALRLGSRHGFRNAFVTLIQPSGTVGLLMGCDTTAIEPDYSMVKLKRLSGGSSMKIVNQSIRKALENMGYAENQVEDIELYVAGNNTLDGAPHINRTSLAQAGIIEKDLDAIEATLDSAIQLRDAFHDLSPDSIRNIGLIPGKHDGVNLFKQMNFTKDQYIAATKWICGHGTIEGAPHVKPDHLPVFDCAARSGFGSRYLRWQAHVRMMSAVSPFISGGISKTLNLPSEASEDTIASAMLMSFDGRGATEYCPGGVKCITIYRDGSKRSQPLINPYETSWWQPPRDQTVYLRGTRKRPPSKRTMIAHEAIIKSPTQNQKVIVKFGEYEDGSLSEIWIEVTKDNPSFYFAMKWASRAISNAIQYGMPMDDILKSFANEKGGPGGPTDHPYITYCESIIDFAVKLAMLEYEGDITFCRRRPPLHEIRCGQIKKSTKKEVKLEEKTVHLRKVVDENSCPKCGSTNIQRYPCETCLRCGASLGGCSP